MHSPASIFVGIFCALMPVSVYAQGAPPAPQTTTDPKLDTHDDCLIESGHVVCRVKENDPRPVGPLKVPNATRVVIRIINKSPFDDCSLGDVKLTDIKESDPIVTILQLLTKGLAGPLPADVKEASDATDRTPIQQRTPAENLLRDLLDMRTAIANEIEKVGKNLVQENLDVARRVDKLFADPPRSPDKYDVGDIETRLTDITSSPEPSLESEQIRLGLLHDRLKDVISKQTPAEAKVIAADELALDNLSGSIATLKAIYDTVTAAHVQFRTVLAFLNQTDTVVTSHTTNPFQKDIFILPYTQQTASTTITCSNTFSKKLSTPQVAVTVLYQKNPSLSVSVGPLLSTIAKQKLGTTAVSTGMDSSGKPTFKSLFAIVDHAPIQIIPFAFFNYRFHEFHNTSNPAIKPVFSLHASVGVGVNPNSGTNEPEFFVGPSVGIKNLLIQVGDHIGRFQKGFNGGFNIGDTVPASFPTALPIHKIYRNAFGIALSYRLPL
jgi:hypothetical protein